VEPVIRRGRNEDYATNDSKSRISGMARNTFSLVRIHALARNEINKGKTK
jgi:hypothetical protein